MLEILLFGEECYFSQKEILKNCLQSLHISYELYHESSAEKVIRAIIKRPEMFDIVIFANAISDMLSIGTALREHTQIPALICVCEKIQNINNLLKIRPSGIILPDFSEKTTSELFNRVILEMNTFKPCFVIKTKDATLRLDYDKILYFSSDKRIVNVYMSDGRIYGFYGKISEITEIIKRGFIRCHQSYLVNVSKIQILDKEERRFILTNGFGIEISKVNYKEIAEQFENSRGVFAFY